METSRCFLTYWRPWGSHHKAVNPEIPWETNHKNMGHIGVNHGLGLLPSGDLSHSELENDPLADDFPG